NYDGTGTTFVRTLIDLKYSIALERYLYERPTEQAAATALETFVSGIADWESKEPGAKRDMLLSFGLFNAPPGGINKLPNVDFHVWMDRQMNLVANHPTLSGIAGLNWCASAQAGGDSVRCGGKLYRHYAIEGQTGMLTRDPLFLTHLRNADFAGGGRGLDVARGRGGQHRAPELPEVRPHRGALSARSRPDRRHLPV